MILTSLSGCIFEDEEPSSNGEVLAVFNYSPSENIRVGDTISFDASSSTPNDGRLTYRWDFDNDSSVDKTGMTAEWSYDSPGTKTIVLTISDGSITSEQIRELTIAVATAVEPTAEITQYADSEDCEDNDIDEERYIVLWMCHYDKSQTDRDVSETTTVSLDASNSAAGNVDEYISEYNWDIDLNIDADNDGDFENDADYSGETVTWADVVPGEYKIKLNIINSQDMVDSDTIKVYVSYAAKWSDLDEDTHIVLWMCYYEKSQTDRDVSETTSVSLDASNSVAGNPDEYISEYNWDLDLNDDADNDGDSENDADLTGESITWNEVEPGEYKIKLNIINSQDMVDSDTIKVYVSYAAKWSDFEIGSNTSSNNENELDFDVSISYDKDSGNTIKKAVAELTYPQQDDDCFGPGTNNCRAKLDVYAYNEDDDEARNTSSVGLDQRNDGDDCDGANDCVFLTISAYLFGDSDNEGTYGDGDWTFKIENREKANDLRVESFIIRLVYV